MSTTSERVYIDIAFVRIQRYLARTSKLRGLRSASAGMAEATDSASLATRLTPGLATANGEAGKADGVVSLKLLDARPEGREERVHQVIDAVLAALREEFPAAELQATWGVGESYVSAYVKHIGPRTRNGDVWSDFPALPEFPPAQLCPLCGSDPATEWERLPEAAGERRLVCVDCARRLRRWVTRTGKGRTTGPSARKSAEQQLEAELELAAAPEALEDLAPMGAGERKRNHLATVYIDGNSVGSFFRRLVSEASQRPELHGLKKTISPRLAELTQYALAIGATEVIEVIRHESGTRYTGRLPVVPHVVGGDDVLVSVPATYAWAFVVGYLRTFDEAMRDELVGPIAKEHGIRLPVPSASAGVVFAHHSHPMYLLVDLAEERLRAAKRASAGRVSSVDFLDLTTDGPQGAGDPPVMFSDLAADETLDALDRLATLGRSHRTRLAQALRDHGDEISAESRAHRAGALPAVAPFLRRSGGRPPRTGITLRQALRIAAWWRPMGPTVRSGM